MSLWSEAFNTVSLFAEKQLGGILPRTKRQQQFDQFQKVLWNVLENVPCEVYLFAGTAVVYCVYQKLYNGSNSNSNTGDGSNPSKSRLTAEEIEWEAKMYAQKKQSNYKDPGLQAVMSAMSETKKKLRRVENPEEARKQKLKTLKVQAKSVTPLGISKDSLQVKLSSLRKVENEPIQKENEASSSYLKEWRSRLRNVAVN